MGVRDDDDDGFFLVHGVYFKRFLVSELFWIIGFVVGVYDGVIGLEKLVQLFDGGCQMLDFFMDIVVKGEVYGDGVWIFNVEIEFYYGGFF